MKNACIRDKNGCEVVDGGIIFNRIENLPFSAHFSSRLLGRGTPVGDVGGAFYVDTGCASTRTIN